MLYLYIFFGIVLAYSFINSRIKTNRQVHFNEMNRIYSKMERMVYEKGLYNNTTIIKYLVPFKNFSINRGYADIQVLTILVARQTKAALLRKKKNINDIEPQIPEELKSLGKEFNAHVKAAISLSFFKAEFITFFVYKLAEAIGKVFFQRSISGIKIVFKNIDYAIRYENVVIGDM